MHMIHVQKITHIIHSRKMILNNVFKLVMEQLMIINAYNLNKLKKRKNNINILAPSMIFH